MELERDGTETLRLPSIVRVRLDSVPISSIVAPASRRPRGSNGKNITSSSSKKSSSMGLRSSRKLDRACTYAVMPGNNSRAVLNEFRKRPWWNGSNADTQGIDLSWEMYKNKKQFKDKIFKKTLVNHLYMNQCLVSKKGLYKTITNYCSSTNLDPLNIIPRTFYLDADETSSGDDFLSFCAYNAERGSSSEEGGAPESGEPVWILKPASQTNRGMGIKVARGLEAALEIARGRCPPSREQSQQKEVSAARRRALAVGWVVQEYMERPLLVSGRKFDIRCFVLLILDKHNGLQGYYFPTGYIRTSSKVYSLKNLSDREAHLTNDAVQVKSKTYGQFEECNKLNYSTWQTVIEREYKQAPPNVIQEHILPKLEEIVRISVSAASQTLTSGLDCHVERSFEVLGYDFMVKECDFSPVLIEINSNPCLEYVSPMIENIISSMVSGVFMTAVDSVYPPPAEGSRSKMCQSAVEALQSQENAFKKIYP